MRKIMKLVLCLSLALLFTTTKADASLFNSKSKIISEMKSINSNKFWSDKVKKDKIKSIWSKSTKKVQRDYDIWKSKEIESANKKLENKMNADPFYEGTKKYVEILDDGTTVEITLEDCEVDENNNEITPKLRASSVWKNYGNRKYTYTYKASLSPIIGAQTHRLINYYTVSASGLKSRGVVETSYTAGLLISIKCLSSGWQDKSATKVGHNIDSRAKWRISYSLGLGNATQEKFQRAYMKIVQFDKKINV
ncbi:hypothetical protein OKW22_000008 [Bacilli bacterium PM5-3]|nr:hypothetical protein [Bacilli bacterium PM5-3]